MAMMNITGANQWWSDVYGWFIPVGGMDYPYLRDSSISLCIIGDLANGTIINLTKRLRSKFNNGTPGPTLPVMYFDLNMMNNGGYSEDYSKVVNGQYEFNLGCGSIFGSGDTVSVGLL